MKDLRDLKLDNVKEDLKEELSNDKEVARQDKKDERSEKELKEDYAKEGFKEDFRNDKEVTRQDKKKIGIKECWKEELSNDKEVARQDKKDERSEKELEEDYTKEDFKEDFRNYKEVTRQDNKKIGIKEYRKDIERVKGAENVEKKCQR